MSIFTKVADFAHRATVVFLMGFTGFQAYQVGRNLMEGRVSHPTQLSTYFKDVEDKVKEEYEKDAEAVHDKEKRDLYPEDDFSYIQKQVRPNFLAPEFQKQYAETEKKQ
jgi:hypothetical protein